MMKMTEKAIEVDRLREGLANDAAGALVTFEGWIRNENEGREVLRLEYEAYGPLCLSEGQTVIDEACRQFPVIEAHCVHRTGLLSLSDCAVWVGVSSAHRDEAFAACRYIIDQVKIRLPIWKKEHYVNGDSGWVNCERCARHGEGQHDAGIALRAGGT